VMFDHSATGLDLMPLPHAPSARSPSRRSPVTAPGVQHPAAWCARPAAGRNRSQTPVLGCDLCDISRSGILLEYAQRVQVGDVYRVAFQVDGLHLKVTARAVRSSVTCQSPVASSSSSTTRGWNSLTSRMRLPSGSQLTSIASGPQTRAPDFGQGVPRPPKSHPCHE
jgi:hypothetical protein